MKTLFAPALTRLVAAIMRAAGCDEAEAATIARRLVEADLVGHDSHGVLRVGKYLEWMRAGWLRANEKPSVVFESETIAIVDGNRGFGQVVGEFTGRLGTTKAAKTGIALVGLRNCGHLGRVGDWAELAAEAGQVSLHFLNTSGALRVAPERRSRSARLAQGILLDGKTWEDLVAAAASVGIARAEVAAIVEAREA
jgi:hydroxycarboxylate dehydrogenase B